MSSLPSLSQSIRPTPPLIDSTIYFLSGEEICGTVRPAFWAISSNCGTGDGATGDGTVGDGAVGTLGVFVCAGENAAKNNHAQKPTRVRMVKRICKL